MLTKSNFNTTTFQLEHRLALSKVLLSYALLIFETLKKAHELQKVLENKDVHHSRMLARPLPGHDIFHFFASETKGSRSIYILPTVAGVSHPNVIP